MAIDQPLTDIGTLARNIPLHEFISSDFAKEVFNDDRSYGAPTNRLWWSMRELFETEDLSAKTVGELLDHAQFHTLFAVSNKPLHVGEATQRFLVRLFDRCGLSSALPPQAEQWRQPAERKLHRLSAEGWAFIDALQASED